MPVVVVGGGLTAIDTATEALAYYPVQVEKFLSRYEALAAERWRRGGRDRMERRGARDRRGISGPRSRDSQRTRGGRARGPRIPRIVELLQAWGGATIAYRRRLIDSPSYTLNHEEIEKALEEGIRFAEGIRRWRRSRRVRPRVALRVSRHHNDGDGVWHEFAQTSLPARTILVAAGTQPNTVLAREDGAALSAGRTAEVLPAAQIRGDGEAAAPGQGPRQARARPGAHRRPGRRPFISFYGDNHPSYAGNVVKAMAQREAGYTRSSTLRG